MPGQLALVSDRLIIKYQTDSKQQINHSLQSCGNSHGELLPVAGLGVEQISKFEQSLTKIEECRISVSREWSAIADHSCDCDRISEVAYLGIPATNCELSLI